MKDHSDPHMEREEERKKQENMNTYKFMHAPRKYRLRHARDTYIVCITVGRVDKLGTVIFTGDGHGLVKIWGYRASPVLLQTLSHGSFTPVLSIVLTESSCESHEWLVCAAGGHACFVWSLESLERKQHRTLENAGARFNIPASSLALYKPLAQTQDYAARIFPQSLAIDSQLFVISASRDGTVKMWELLDSRGNLKRPILEEYGDDKPISCRSFRRQSGIANLESGLVESSKILRQFVHNGQVTSVAAIPYSVGAETKHVILTSSCDRSRRMWSRIMASFFMCVERLVHSRSTCHQSGLWSPPCSL